MSYTASTDFVGLWRAVAGGVEKVEMPGLDFVTAALYRSGLLNISISSTQPVANQSTTAWFQPASPSYSAEGALYLWNGAAYVAASQSLMLEMLAAAEKAAGRTNAVSSLMDTLSTTQGAIAYRNASGWVALAPGTAGYLLTTGGPAANPSWTTIGSVGGALDGVTNTVGALPYRGGGGWVGTGAGAQWTVLNNSVANTPAWTTLSALIDGAIGSTRGALLERGAAGWALVTPGASGTIFVSGGAGADPSWTALSTVSNSIGGDVALNNVATYFTGPTCAQGTTGTWLATGTVTVQDTAGTANIVAKLWDGTTVIASAGVTISSINELRTIALSGVITNPAGNIRIDVKDVSSTSGKIISNASGNSKDSTLTVTRIG